MKPYKSPLKTNFIKVGARASKLSLKQVEEIDFAIRYHNPSICLGVLACQTKGDCDQKTSLREMGKTDFFTYEIDQWLKKGRCQIAIHSAKDLPDPIDDSLEIVAITKSLCSDDVIVFHPNRDLSKLPSHLTIATSSLNRERNVLKQYPNAQIVDLRGTIEKRLQRVFNQEVDGVVIAKVALMRLGIDDQKMVTLKGSTTPLQGSLAILARKGDQEMKELFSSIDSRRNEKSLYLGISPKRYLTRGDVTHVPLIEIEPCYKEWLFAMKDLIEKATYLIITSQTTAYLLSEMVSSIEMSKEFFRRKKIVAVGQATFSALLKKGFLVSYMAKEESQEGIIALLDNLKFKADDFILYPKSQEARPKLENYLQSRNLLFKAPSLYRPQKVFLKEKPDLSAFDEIVFTSPSTVKSFFDNFKEIPSHLRVVCKGFVTRNFLNNELSLKL